MMLHEIGQTQQRRCQNTPGNSSVLGVPNMELKTSLYHPIESCPGSRSNYTITVALNMIMNDCVSTPEKACNPRTRYYIVERDGYKGIGLTSAPDNIRTSLGLAG